MRIDTSPLKLKPRWSSSKRRKCSKKRSDLNSSLLDCWTHTKHGHNRSCWENLDHIDKHPNLCNNAIVQRVKIREYQVTLWINLFHDSYIQFGSSIQLFVPTSSWTWKRVLRVTGASPSCQRVEAGWHPGWVATTSQGHTATNNSSHSRIHRENLQTPRRTLSGWESNLQPVRHQC